MSEEIGSGTETGSKMNYGTTTKVGNQEDPAEENGRKRADKVISGEVIERKKGLGRKITETFTGVDARAVGSHVIFDVILPQLKGMAVDAGTQALERLILGESGLRRSSSSSPMSPRVRGSNYTAYNRYSPNSGSEDREPVNMRSNEVREVIVNTRGDAQNVLDEMFRQLDEYKSVTVADFYDLVGITGKFTDNQWGWSNLNASGVSRVREGFRIELPRPISLK